VSGGQGRNGDKKADTERENLESRSHEVDPFDLVVNFKRSFTLMQGGALRSRGALFVTTFRFNSLSFGTSIWWRNGEFNCSPGEGTGPTQRCALGLGPVGRVPSRGA